MTALADGMRAALAQNMRMRGHPDQPSWAYVQCNRCGWGDAAPVVIEKYLDEPFGCHRHEIGQCAGPEKRGRPKKVGQ